MQSSREEQFWKISIYFQRSSPRLNVNLYIIFNFCHAAALLFINRLVLDWAWVQYFSKSRPSWTDSSAILFWNWRLLKKFQILKLEQKNKKFKNTLSFKFFALIHELRSIFCFASIVKNGWAVTVWVWQILEWLAFLKQNNKSKRCSALYRVEKAASLFLVFKNLG